MKITGIIAEYNPVHNGHKYHIDHIKKTGSAIVAIMSGNFVQRGEPAVFDKFTRTLMALKAGIDIVVELPCCYALQAADGFAFGGTSILDSLNIDTISFGSECGSIETLTNAAEKSLSHETEINSYIKNKMNDGISYSNAKLTAEQKFTESTYAFSMPNNLLGIEYIKAIKKNKLTITPSTIVRKGNNHTDDTINSIFSSAKAIRNSIYKNNTDEIIKNIPECIHENFVEACRVQKVTTESYYDIINYKIRTSSPEELSEIQGVSEGFEYKIRESAFSSGNYNEFRNNLKTKRYSENRISRILISILLNITKSDILESKKADNFYAHVLGFRKDSVQILSAISKNSRIPIITKAAELDEHNALMKKDILATDLYFLASRQTGRKDYSTKLITI